MEEKVRHRETMGTSNAPNAGLTFLNTVSCRDSSESQCRPLRLVAITSVPQLASREVQV